MRRRNRYSLIWIFLLFSCSNAKEEKGVSYYPNGQLKHEVLLVNGQPEGLGIIYYKSGKVKSRTYWKRGKKHGKSVHYYENGNVQQETQYQNDIHQLTKDYGEDGLLRKVRKYDSLGRLFDFCVFNKNGTRDFSRKTKDPIFITEDDTISVGQTFEAEVKLGNRQFDYIDVIIGDIDDPYLAVNTPPLPKKDSLTSILTIKGDSPGLKRVSGILIERSAVSDSVEVIPFIFPLFVEDTSKDIAKP